MSKASIGHAEMFLPRGLRASLFIATWLGLNIFALGTAHAQVLLLPLDRGAGTVPDVSPVAEMAATTGTSLRSHDAAREALEERYGVDPPEMSESDLARWVASSRQAVRSLARADYDGARSALALAESVSDRALAELNREATRSRQVLDTCLYLVRSLEETDQHARALEQGFSCRRLVPRGAATPTQHPPEVRAILDEVDRTLAAMPGARLRIVSEPSGCAVRLNGLEFGATPLLTEDLRPGEYRVQVECSGTRRGRVHRIDLGRNGAEMRIDSLTETLFQSEPLRIMATTVDGSLVARVAHLGGLAGAREVWLVDVTEGATPIYTLHRIDVATSREVAIVRTQVTSLPLALASLRQGRSHDWTTDQQIETVGAVTPPPELVTAPTVEVAEPQTQRRLDARHVDESFEMPPGEGNATAVGADHTAETVIGVIAIALGAGAYGSAWALWQDRATRLGSRLTVARPSDPDYLQRQEAWLNAQATIWGLSAGGAVLWTLAVPLTFGPDRDVPAWTWVLGVVGIAGVGAGIGVAIDASGRICATSVETEQPCIDSAAQQDLGWLIAAQAAPFIAFPITHLIRSASSPSTSLSLQLDVSPQQTGVTLRGQF